MGRKTGGGSAALSILTALLCFGVGMAHAELKVLTIPKNPRNPNIPHSAYNGKQLIFKAIARGGDGNYAFSWDFDGDGNYDFNGNSGDAYNLSTTHTYPNQAQSVMYVANVRVQSAGETAFGTYLVYLDASVPTQANANNATDDHLLVMSDVALDDALWRLHILMSGRGGSNQAMTGHIPHNSGGDWTIATSAAGLWALVLNGHFPAYPSGTYSGPEPAGFIDDNDDLWRRSPYSEDALRVTNWILGQLSRTGINTDDEADDGRPAIANTNTGHGLTMGDNTYRHSIPTAAISVVASNFAETNTQAGNGDVINKPWKYIVQEMLDYVIYQQIDSTDKTADGSWLYTSCNNCNWGAGSADGSTAQWAAIGVEAALRTMTDAGVIVNNRVLYRLANNLKYNADPNNPGGGARYRNNSSWAEGMPTSPWGRLQLTGGTFVQAGMLGWNDTNVFNCGGAGGEQPYQPYSTVTRCEARNLYDNAKRALDDAYNNHWRDGNYNSGATNQGWIYALYSSQKGARSVVPEISTWAGRNWWREYQVWGVRGQRADGSYAPPPRRPHEQSAQHGLHGHDADPLAVHAQAQGDCQRRTDHRVRGMRGWGRRGDFRPLPVVPPRRRAADR